MATYLQGVTDYVPQVQPWRPNYNFYQPIFQQKQAKYDQGWNKVNNLYNSVLNAPMLREDNKLHRDDFFKNVQQQIQQLSGVDLSLAQNIDAATKVFEPFYEDEGIVKDIGFTKTYQDQLQLSENLRNCTDPEKCGDKYWNGGVRAMNYQAEDFVNATPEEALKMRAPRYTEYYNLMKNAEVAVREAGFSMKVDSKDGGYIVTDKNGSQMTMPLMNFMMQRFGNDPRLQEFYATKAMLLTREDPKAANAMYLKSMQNSEAPKEQLQQEANDEAFTQTYEDSKNVISVNANKEANRFMNMIKKKAVLESRIKKNGAVPGSYEANEFLSSVRDANVQEGVVNDLNNMNESAQNTDQGIKEQGLSANKDQMTNVIANALKIQDMYKTANSLAYRDYEHTMKADPFALQNNSFANSKKLASIRNQYDLTKQAYKFIYDKSMHEVKNAQETNAAGTGVNYWSRPSTNPQDRINEFKSTGNSSGQPPAPGSEGTQLASMILAGMSNPMSYVSSNPEMIANLIEEGRTQDAIKAAQGNTVENSTRILGNAGFKMPDITYDSDKAGSGVNIMNSTLKRYDLTRKNAGFAWGGWGPVYRSDMDHNNETIKDMRDGFNSARAYVAGRVNEWKNDNQKAKTQINNDVLATQFNIAGDELNSESDAMQIELLDFTTHIDGNFKKFGRMSAMRKKFHGDISKDYQAYKRAADSGWGNIPSLTADEFKTLRWGMPINATGDAAKTWAATSKQFRKIKNIGMEKLIALAGGNDELYKFNKDAGGVWAINDESTSDVSRLTIDDESKRPADQLMSHSDYAKYSTLRQEEAGNVNDDGTFVNSELSSEIIDRLNRYERFTGATNFERKWGIGSGIKALQTVNNAYAQNRVEIDLKETAIQQAIDKHNTGLSTAANQLYSQTNDVSGSIWNAIKDKLIKEGGDGELSKLATKSELNGIIAESIPELLADPSFSQTHNLPFHGKWGHSIKKMRGMYMYDGKTSTKSMLNMFSRSNYASEIGARQGGVTGQYKKPDYRRSANGYTQAIAGWKFAQDQKKPFEQREFTNLAQAYAQANAENPYGSRDYASPPTTRDVTDASRDSSETYNTDDVLFLQYLGKYEDAISKKYNNNEYKVSPNFSWYNEFKNQSDPLANSNSSMTFNTKYARMDEAWVNVFEDHNNTIGTAYEEILNNFTDQPSPLGGMFTDDQGKPLGNGTLVSVPAKMNGVTPNRKDQNYFDSQYIIDEAIKDGNFGEGSIGPEVLNKLRAALKDPEGFSKGKAPMWDLQVHAFNGGLGKESNGVSTYELTLIDDTWLSAQGYNKKLGGGGGLDPDTAAPSVYKWTVDNPTDAISMGAHPTAWDATVGSLGLGETYTNNAIDDQYGNIHYSKTDKGSIQPGYTIDMFNPQTGEEEEISFYAPVQSYYGTDWISQQINLVDEMIQAKNISDDTKKQWTMMRGVRDPQELLSNMAEKFGISVEELVQSFK